MRISDEEETNYARQQVDSGGQALPGGQAMRQGLSPLCYEGRSQYRTNEKCSELTYHVWSGASLVIILILRLDRARVHIIIMKDLSNLRRDPHVLRTSFDAHMD